MFFYGILALFSAPVLPNVSSPRGFRSRKGIGSSELTSSGPSPLGQWGDSSNEEGSGTLFGDLGFGFGGKSSNPLFKSIMGQVISLAQLKFSPIFQGFWAYSNSYFLFCFFGGVGNRWEVEP